MNCLSLNVWGGTKHWIGFNKGKKKKGMLKIVLPIPSLVQSTNARLPLSIGTLHMNCSQVGSTRAKPPAQTGIDKYRSHTIKVSCGQPIR